MQLSYHVESLAGLDMTFITPGGLVVVTHVSGPP
jgi:hypothetical protein